MGKSIILAKKRRGKSINSLSNVVLLLFWRMIYAIISLQMMGINSDGSEVIEWRSEALRKDEG